MTRPEGSEGPLDVLERAERASALLADPVLKEAFERARQAAIEDWIGGETTHDREEAWHRVHALAEARRMLRVMLDDGEHAKLRGGQ